MEDIKKAVVTVLGYDQKGIIARVSNLLYKNDVNIMDISQTIISGLFNMVLVADITSPGCDFEKVSQDLAELGKELGIQIRIQRSEIFEAMHEV